MEKDEVIFSYTSKDAVDDGILFEVKQITKKDNGFSYITTNLMEKHGYLKDDKINIPALLDLLNQCVNLVNKQYVKDGKADWFYSGIIKDTNDENFKVFIALNELEKFTIMLPEDY